MPKEVQLTKPKQTRKRVPRTCAQCRKRKQKCDSLKPCAVCKLRGEADLCDYSGAQPTRVLDEEDEATNQVSSEELKVLRQQLDDLEHAITLVFNHPPAGTSPPLGTNDITHQLAIDMDEFNLASMLSSFLTSRVVPSEFSQEFPIIQKVRRQCQLDQNLPPAPNTNFYASSGLSTYFSNQFNQSHYSELRNRLPTREQSAVLLATYMKEFGWYHACFNAEAYTTALESLYTSPAAGSELEKGFQANFIIMGTAFAIARSSIIKLSSQSSIELNLSVDPSDRLEQSKMWLDMSVACLKCGDFEANPLLESVRCLIILLEVAWFDEIVGGIDDLPTLFDLKSKAIQLAFDLSLHRDPSHRDPMGTVHVNPTIARERRMVWWALLSIDGLYSGLTGRMSSISGLEAVDVFLPALSTSAFPDETHEGCEQGCTTSTPATGIKPRLLLGYVGNEISRLPLQRTPLPTINDIHQAHRDLVLLEFHLPDSYKLHTINGHCIDRARLPQCSKARRDAIFFYMRYHYLLVKLHSPLHFIKKGQDIPGFETKHPYHRSAVVDHSLLLLDLRNLGNFSPDYIYGNVMVIEAAFSLALDFLYDPKGEFSSLIKIELQNLCKFLQNSKLRMIKRGLGILQCLMATWGSPPPTGTISWFSVNKPNLLNYSWVQGPYHQPAELTNFSGTGQIENGPEKLNQSELPVNESPDQLAGRQQSLNHASWPAPGPLINPHSPPVPLSAQSYSSHQPQSQQHQHHTQMPNYNSSISEYPTEFSQFNQSAPPHAQVIGHSDPFHQFSMLPTTSTRGHPADHNKNINARDDSSHYSTANTAGESRLNLDDFFSEVNRQNHPGSAPSGTAARFENSQHHPLAAHRLPELPSSLQPAVPANHPIHNHHQLSPHHHYQQHHHHQSHHKQQLDQFSNPPIPGHHIQQQNQQNQQNQQSQPHQHYSSTHAKW